MNMHTATVIRSDRPVKWQQILSDLITDPEELLQILQLKLENCPFSVQALAKFPLKAPRPYVDRIEKGNWQDPLLMQIWPAEAEELETEGFLQDPLEEENFNPVPGLLHKYHGRVLLTAAPHCAIHCRYCFRRHFDYAANSPSRAEWDAVFSYIANDKSIEEVILSGGDPLALPDRQFSWLLEQLAAIKHVSTVRVHTRLPVVIPQRVTTELVHSLRDSRLQAVMVMHCNHAAELDIDVAESFRILSENGIILLNQSVLLKDVNDNSPALVNLSKALFEHNVLPYYLHMPDRVAWTQHFYISDEHAKQLIKEMHAVLPGYLIPRLVREIPGQRGKTPIV